MIKHKSTQVVRVDNCAVRGGVMRFALPLIGGILALSLAGCSSKSNLTEGTFVGTLFSSSDKKEQAPAPQVQQAVAQAKPISFAPIIGAPAKISSKMSEELVAASTAKGLKVESSAGSGYVVRGYLVAASAQNGTKLSYIWDIRDQSGQRAQRFQGDELIEGKKGGDPWALVDDAAMKRVAASTADKIAVWMLGAANTPTAQVQPDAAPSARGSATVQTASVSQPEVTSQPSAPQTSANVAIAQPANKGEIIAIVPPVTGAPGDGQQSLTSAMKKYLAGAGVRLAEGARGTAYTVRGTVELGSAEGGQQPITIRWLVIDPNGKQIDKAVVQRNKIPAGSLDGPWGQVADLAASEAAKSVAKLIRPTG